MIKPSDIPTPFADRDLDQRVEIEAHIDASLQSARRFPHLIPKLRSGWTHGNVALVLGQYAAIGWRINRDDDRGLATFDRPERDA